MLSLGLIPGEAGNGILFSCPPPFAALAGLLLCAAVFLALFTI